jgi:hypothetical protein
MHQRALFVKLVIGFSLLMAGAPNAQAQNTREVDAGTRLVYFSRPIYAVGFGVDVYVRLTNISSTPQEVTASLYNERVQVVAFIRNRVTDFRLPWVSGGGDQINTGESSPFFMSPIAETSGNANGAARSSLAGYSVNAILAPKGQPRSVWEHTFSIACDYGPETVRCYDGVQAGDTPGMKFYTHRATMPGERNTNNDCSPPSHKLYDANTNDYAGPGVEVSLVPTVAEGSYPPDFLCKLEAFYHYGVRVRVNQARGAVVGSVSHRNFALGGGISQIELVSESLAINGGRAF